MAFTKTYSANQVLVVYNGKIVQGIALDNGIQIERNVDAVTGMAGTDGSYTRSITANKSGRVTLTLNQSSPSNDDLMAQAQADELNGTGVGALFIKDNLGTTLVTAAEAWIVKLPQVAFAEAAGTRQWVLEAAVLNVTIGGN